MKGDDTMKFLNSIQFKRKCSFTAIGLGGIGLLYLMYYKGRCDEINEFCSIVKENGSIIFTYQLKDGIRKIFMEDIT